MQKAPNKEGENSNRPAFHFSKGLMVFDLVQPKTTLIDVNIDSLEKIGKMLIFYFRPLQRCC